MTANPNEPPRVRITRVGAGGLLLMVAVGLTVAVGVGSVLAVAMVAASPWVLGVTGLVAVGLTAFLSGRPVFRLFQTRHRGRSAMVFAAAVVSVVAVAAGTTILRPGPVNPVSAAPKDTKYWQLETGSHLAYLHQAATAPARPAPVVFLHGGPGTPGEGLPAAAGELAADGFEVYSYDQLGAGRSTRLSDVTGYTVARQVADLEAIRRVIGADQLILVGQSWGGTLAAHYLAAHPTRVAKVVFTSPGALWEPAYPDGIGDPWLRLSPTGRAEYDEMVSSPRIVAATALLAVNPSAAHALVPDGEADTFLHDLAVVGKDATTCPGSPGARVHDNPQGFYVNQVTNADVEQSPDPRPALRTSTVQALILRGECDFLHEEVTEEYRRTLPESVLVRVPGAGHSIAGTQPVAYLELLSAFLTDQPLPAP